MFKKITLEFKNIKNWYEYEKIVKNIIGNDMDVKLATKYHFIQVQKMTSLIYKRSIHS